MADETQVHHNHGNKPTVRERAQAAYERAMEQHNRQLAQSPTRTTWAGFCWTRRTCAGLSTNQLAKKLGVAGSTVWRWENANSKPEFQQVLSFAEATGTDQNEALEMAGYLPPSTGGFVWAQSDPEPAPQTWGEFCRARREELGLSQGRLAGRIGVTRQTVCRWETNRFRPEFRQVLDFVQATGVDRDGALEVAGYSPGDGVVQAEQRGQESRSPGDVIRNLLEITPSEQAAVRDGLRWLADRFAGEGAMPRPGDSFRVGGSVPRNLYWVTDRHPVGLDVGRIDHSPELAAWIVDAANNKVRAMVGAGEAYLNEIIAERDQLRDELAVTDYYREHFLTRFKEGAREAADFRDERDQLRAKLAEAERHHDLAVARNAELVTEREAARDILTEVTAARDRVRDKLNQHGPGKCSPVLPDEVLEEGS